MVIIAGRMVRFIDTDCLMPPATYKNVLESLAVRASLPEVLDALVRSAEETRPHMLCSVLLLDSDGKHLRHGAAPSLPDFYNQAIDGVEIGPEVGSCGAAAFTGERVIVADVFEHPFWADYRDLAQKAGIRACWSEPILSAAGEILGTFAIYYREPREPDQGDLEFINNTAHLAGVAMELERTQTALRNAHDELEARVEKRTEELVNLAEELGHKNQQMEADLRMAREIQRACLPHSYPCFPGNVLPEESALRFSHRYIPTTTLAGDFFLIVPISDREAGILICDVMGHGVRASLVTALLRGLVEERMPMAVDPGAFLMEINHGLSAVLRQSGSPLFVTAFYMVADVANRVVRFANAGHPNPVCVRRNLGTVDVLGPGDEPPEPALGVIEEYVYTSRKGILARNDLFVMYTDGVFIDEADGPPFGESDLIAVLQDAMALPTEQLLDALLGAIQSRARGPELADDLCIVAAEIAR